ncbi:Cysteine-rich protein [Phytophthora palmivora]|uniref:Cysteine-rich protein n=1 Tax=Phytophthora palmivora TaxID=4796 RepID=A0A2P4YBV6_9STRA|nr:Cysteine-rich protein [Phytophthora palmivora]
MVFKTLFLLALGVSSTLAADDGSLTMAVGTNGTTVQAESGTTEFMGTEYNPSKCLLQFVSLECDDNCAELNGYELECVSQGKQNGKEKKMCECKSEDANVCQNSVNPNATSGTVAQFGECSDQNQCVDSYGYIPTSTEEGPICAEKLHCVQEINTTATEPASICHTCMSCIAQNDAADKQLAGVKRFNCSAICPQEIIDTVAERNAAGVAIAESYSLTA